MNNGISQILFGKFIFKYYQIFSIAKTRSFSLVKHRWSPNGGEDFCEEMSEAPK